MASQIEEHFMISSIESILLNISNDMEMLSNFPYDDQIVNNELTSEAGRSLDQVIERIEVARQAIIVLTQELACAGIVLLQNYDYMPYYKRKKAMKYAANRINEVIGS